MEKEKILDKLHQLIKTYYSLKEREFVPGKTKIPLNIPTFSSEEVYEALESMLSTWVTMGKKVKTFEEMFSEYLNVDYSFMVNSGSSANLIALSILTNPALKNRIRPGDEIITPATTWITTVYPILNVNAIPVIVDVELNNFNIKVADIERAINKNTKAIMPVHLLGNPCNIEEIMEIAEEHNLFVIEDSCEAHGAKVNGKMVGTFGDLGTFSFFFSHHISTMEGGMVVTDIEEYYELGKALRAFGWIRNLKDSDKIAKKYDYIDKKFLFTNLGFNFRPTEIQGAFGVHQIKKLEKFIDIRRKNAKYWNEELESYSDYISTQREKKGIRHVWFGYPITVNSSAPFTKEDFVNYLEKRKIETRPIQVPNIAEQPVIKLMKHKIVGELENAKYIAKNSFWFGNHHGVGKQERKYIAESIIEFIESRI